MELVPLKKFLTIKVLVFCKSQTELSHFVNAHGTGPPLYSYTLSFLGNFAHNTSFRKYQNIRLCSDLVLPNMH